MPWTIGRSRRCAQPATPPPRRSRAGRARLSHVAADELESLSANHLAANENGTANTSATDATGADRPPVEVHGHSTVSNGWRRPSLPGLRMPFGSSASFTALQHVELGAERLGHEPRAVQPDAVVVRQVAAGGEHGALAGIPQRHVRRLDLGRRWGGGEREVQARPVRVAVRKVTARGAGVGHGEQRGAGLVEDRRKCRPRRRDLHRVDHETLAGQGLQGTGVVAVGEPALDERVVGSSARGRTPRRRSPSSRRRSPGRPRRAPAARDRTPSPSWPRWLSTSSYRRSTAGVAARRRIRRHASMPVGERVERPRAMLGRRRQGMGAQPHPGDDAERALGAEEQSAEVGSGGRRRCAAGAHDGSVGEHDLQPGDDVVDLAVASAVLPGAAARHPAADGGDVEALREVADAQAVAGQLGLQVRPERAGEHLDDAGDLVDGDDAGQPGEVQDDPAAHRRGCAAHPAAPAGSSERDAVVVADATDSADLLDRLRPAHRRGATRHLAGEGPVHRQRPPVAAGLGRRIGVGGGRRRRRAARRAPRRARRHRGRRDGRRAR